MPSVIATWSGQCADLSVQKSLCEKLITIAKLSHSYFRDEAPIKYFDQAIEGNILIEGGFVGENIECKVAEKIVHEYIAERDEEIEELLDIIFETTTEPEHKRDVFYTVKNARLYGIEFGLYDPRDNDPTYNRISFVFLQIDDCPELNGRIVYVVDKERCGRSKDKFIMAADWYLTGPSLDLRYLCENWFDRLMGWVKYFYIPGLHYWRYDDCPGYKDLANSLDQANKNEFDIDKMSAEMLDSLKSDFRKEVREWIERWGVHYDNGNQP